VSKLSSRKAEAADELQLTISHQSGLIWGRGAARGLDDGYTRIANELLEAVMLAGLSQHQAGLHGCNAQNIRFQQKADWVATISYLP
jgi:hypothetical protein